MSSNRSLKMLLSPILLWSSCLFVSPLTLAQTTSSFAEIEIAQQQVESPYDTYMRLGYAAMERQDYSSAINYFRDALFYVPNDREATIAFWNARNAFNDSQTSSDQTPTESNYDRYMRIGYNETNDKDYQSALINFERALEERPGDYYATQAIRNITSYIAAEKGEPLASIESSIIDVAEDHYVGESSYDRYMRLGYAASKESKYITATDYFRSALYERPNDRLATIAFWNAKQNSNQENSSTTDRIEAYDRYMRLGYDATQRNHLKDALTYFQEALKIKPNDEYATQAIRNVTTYIEKGNM